LNFIACFAIFAGAIQAQKNPKPTQNPPTIVGKQWALVYIINAEGKKIQPTKAVNVVFSKDGMSYNPDCNQCGRWAKIDPKKQQISFSPSQKGDVCTELDCGDEVAYHFPYQTMNYTLKAHNLLLKSANYEILLRDAELDHHKK
jgi:hypothetical protein